MSISERIFHAVLFEILAVLLTVIIMSYFTNHSTGLLTSIIVTISLAAMLWNFVFNWICDRLFPGERLERGFGFRVMHTVCFELGLLVFTIPMLAYSLNVDLWTAFIMDIGMTLAVMIYALIYNWLYDYLCAKIVSSK